MKAKRQITLVAIAALIIVATYYFQHRTNNRLQKRLASLTVQLKASDEARQRAEENALNSATAIERVQNGVSELPRLRGEVATLRRAIAEKNATLAKFLDRSSIGDTEKDQPNPVISVFGTEARDF